MYIGLDIGSISTKIAVIDENQNILFTEYIYNKGNPINAVSTILYKMQSLGITKYLSLCTTGSGRKNVGRLLEADNIKNEITALWMGAKSILPDVNTIIEIGGQDSKLITLAKGEIENFKLNTVCAAGTGAFIEQQAIRLDIPLEELSEMAIKATKKVRFSGRCTVFVETEMINLQQMGFPVDAIAAGLIDAICENYLNDLGSEIDFNSPILFCGGVSRNKALKLQFEKKLQTEIIVPELNHITAAIGASLLAKECYHDKHRIKKYKKLKIDNLNLQTLNSKLCTKSYCLECGLCNNKTPLRKAL